MPPGLVIAVDGPGGSGKSSVSREVALRLGIGYLDTGATFRAVCWSALEQGLNLDDEAGVAALARDMDLELSTDPRAASVSVAGHDVTRAIREGRVSSSVSKVATNLAVRAELRARQQALIALTVAERGGVVVEGRDITTVVAPDAPVRVLLVADPQTRVARRTAEEHGGADPLLHRDAADATVSQFHTAADGVTTLDSSSLSFEQTVEALLALVEPVHVR